MPVEDFKKLVAIEPVGCLYRSSMDIGLSLLLQIQLGFVVSIQAVGRARAPRIVLLLPRAPARLA